MIDAFRPVRDFEAALCEYTGAPYAVAVNSCTAALQLACEWQLRYSPMVRSIEIPKRTYVGVGMAIKLAGAAVTFRDEDWRGVYELRPLGIYDSARWLSGDMYNFIRRGRAAYVCLSFHAQKTLGHEQGGAILHASGEADAWFRRARFDGRTEGVHPRADTFDMVGHHCYLSPTTATGLLWKLSYLPKRNDPMPNSDYSDLSLAPIFQEKR